MGCDETAWKLPDGIALATAQGNADARSAANNGRPRSAAGCRTNSGTVGPVVPRPDCDGASDKRAFHSPAGASRGLRFAIPLGQLRGYSVYSCASSSQEASCNHDVHVV